MTTPERWQKLKEFLSMGAEGHSGTRERYLANENPSFRAEAESLLRHQQQPAGALHAYDSFVGQRIGKYEVLERIGEGGMGTVFKARDTTLGRFVALKVLPPLLRADEQSTRRFDQEAKCLSAISHPNIVSVYELAHAGDVHFIAMEFLPGRKLSQCIPKHGIPLKRCLDYARQIASAVTCAHEAGVIHRDLKPSNVLITNDGVAKVVDFGLAKMADSAAPTFAEPLTQAGTVLGTAGYMSPEQARGVGADARSDIFNFGAMLYEMLTGMAPFKRDSPAETLAAVLKDDPSEKEIPPSIGPVVRRCLQKDPDARFQTMREVVSALETARHRNISRVRDPARPFLKQIRRARTFAGLTSLALLITVFFYASSRMREPHPERVRADTTNAAKAAISEGVSDLKSRDFDAAIRAFTVAVDQAPPIKNAAVARYYRGLAYTARVDAGPCLKPESSGCPRESAMTDLDHSVADFSAVLEMERDHPGAHWNRGLAYAKMCEVQSKTGEPTSTFCDRAISDFTDALKAVAPPDNFFAQLPDEANVLFNRGYVHLLESRLASLPTSTRRSECAASIRDFDQLLTGGQRYAHFLNERRRDILDHREAAEQQQFKLASK